MRCYYASSPGSATRSWATRATATLPPTDTSKRNTPWTAFSCTPPVSNSSILAPGRRSAWTSPSPATSAWSSGAWATWPRCHETSGDRLGDEMTQPTSHEERPRVLVVDDEKFIREILAEFLGMEGYL